MPTDNPIPSQDPSDLLFNAPLFDEFVNGEGDHFIDRMGRKRNTLSSLERDFPSASDSMDAAKNAAIEAGNDAGRAGEYAEQAGLARDASIAAAGPLYATEAEGRAAVANGESFRVQGAGAVAATLYRRTSAAASVLLTEFPSVVAVDEARIGLGEAYPNKYFANGEGRNGGVLVFDAGMLTGYSIASGVTGALTYITAFIDLSAELAQKLAGSTIRITAVFEASASFLTEKPLSAAACAALRGNAYVGLGTIVKSVQSGATITRAGQLVVDATDKRVGITIQVRDTAAVSPTGANHTVKIKSLSLVVVDDVASAAPTASDLMLDKRIGDAIGPANRSIHKLGTSDDVISDAIDVQNAAPISGTWPASAFHGWAMVRQFSQNTQVSLLRINLNNNLGSPSDVPRDADHITFMVYELDTAPGTNFPTVGVLLKSMTIPFVPVVGGVDVDLPVDLPMTAGKYYVFQVRAYDVDGNVAGIGSTTANVGSGSASLYGFYNRLGGSWVKLSGTGQIYGRTIETNPYATESRIKDLEDAVTDVSGAPVFPSASLKSEATTEGLQVHLPQITVNMLGLGRVVAAQTITLDAPPQFVVAAQPYSLKYDLGVVAANSNALLADRYYKDMVVINDATSAPLVKDVDYQELAGLGKIIGINAGAPALSTTLSYTGLGARYDIIALNSLTGAVSVIKGTSRRLDPEAYMPQLAGTSGLIPLYSAYVVDTVVKLIPMHKWPTGQTVKAGDEAEWGRWMQHNRRCLSRVLRKLSAGQPVKIAGYGDSITAGGAGDWRAPGGAARDNTDYLQFMPADTRALIPLFDHGDGAGQVHIHVSWNYRLLDFLQSRFGSAITYLNLGIGGTTSANVMPDDGHRGGLNAERLQVLLDLQPDLVVIGFGMNERGSDTTGANVAQIVSQCKAAGADCIVVGVPRINGITLSSNYEAWLKTNQLLALAALQSGAAHCPTITIEGDGTALGYTGLHPDSCCSMNYYNHPSPAQLSAIGRVLSSLFL